MSGLVLCGRGGSGSVKVGLYHKRSVDLLASLFGGLEEAVMAAKALVWVLALLIGITLLITALEWTTPDHAFEGRANGSRPVRLQQCVETPCVVP